MRAEGMKCGRLLTLSASIGTMLLVCASIQPLASYAGVHLSSEPAVDAAGWPTFHGDSQLSGVSSDTAVSTTSAPSLGLRWMTYTGAAVDASPVTAVDASGQTVAYVVNTAGDLEALDTSDGSILWSDYLGVPFYATPTIYGNDLWAGTFVNGHVYKINASTGTVECDITLHTGSLLASPTIATPPGGNPTVFVAVQDNGQITAPVLSIDEASCDVNWSVVPYPASSGVSGSWNPTSFGVDANGIPLVLLGSGDPLSTAYALNAKTGATVWSNRNLHPTGNDVGAGLTISPPGTNGFADGMAYYAGQDQWFYAIDLTTGNTVWTFNYGAATVSSPYKGGRSAAALDGNTLVFGTGAGVMALNAVTGAEIWDSAKTVGPDTDIISSPLITGPTGSEVVVYGDMKGEVHVLSLVTGDQLWSFQTNGFIMASPADTNGQILITSSDGFTYDFAPGATASSTSPTTEVTSPASGSTLSNPNPPSSTSTDITISGQATSPDPNPQVLVAIRQDGPGGSWWNASTGAWQAGFFWNQAGVAPGSGTGSTWTIAAPVGREGGVWQVDARTVDSDGYADPTGAVSQFVISPVTNGPRLTIRPASAAPGASATVSGRGFGDGEQVSLSVGSVSSTVTASSTGTFWNAKLVLDQNFPYGLWAITGTGQTSGLATSAPLWVTSPWRELGNGASRAGYQPSDRVFSQELVPDKVYRMQPVVVSDVTAPIDSSPAVADLTAYFGTQDGQLVAVNTVTGGQRWSVALSSSQVVSSPAIDPANDLGFIGSEDGNLYAFHLDTGTLAWTDSMGGAIDSSPDVARGVVYVGSNSGAIEALNETTGSVLWSAPIAAPGTSSATVDTGNNIVVIGDSSGAITALTATGSSAGHVLWTYQTGGPVTDVPVMTHGAVYVASNDGKEYSLKEGTGALNWSSSIGGTPSLTQVADTAAVYVGSSNGEFEALNPSTGALMWKNQTTAPVMGISAASGVIFAESSNGDLTGYRSSGDLIWLDRAGNALATAPAVADNAVVIGAGDGALYVYTPYGMPMS
jgi:outer membrane protein assembly factor BamB